VKVRVGIWPGRGVELYQTRGSTGSRFRARGRVARGLAEAVARATAPRCVAGQRGTTIKTAILGVQAARRRVCRRGACCWSDLDGGRRVPTPGLRPSLLRRLAEPSHLNSCSRFHAREPSRGRSRLSRGRVSAGRGRLVPWSPKLGAFNEDSCGAGEHRGVRVARRQRPGREMVRFWAGWPKAGVMFQARATGELRGEGRPRVLGT